MRSDPRPRVRARGFTLLEVMIALLIVALGMGAALTTIFGVSDRLFRMREVTLASWVAQNELTRIRLEPGIPEVGRSDGDTEMADTRWRWQAVVSESGVENLRRIEIEVSYEDEPDRIVYAMTGFVTPRPDARSQPFSWRAGGGASGGSPSPGNGGRPSGDDSGDKEPPRDGRPGRPGG